MSKGKTISKYSRFLKNNIYISVQWNFLKICFKEYIFCKSSAREPVREWETDEIHG